LKLIDRISDALGIVGAALMFLTGVFLSYEVAARYVFRAPTSWAQEVSELCLLWGVFLALGRLTARREHIMIEVFYDMLAPVRQRVVDTFALAFVFVVLCLIVYYGFVLAWESLERGSMTSGIVSMPRWWAEAAVPVGCAWAAVQTFVEWIRSITGRGWVAMAHRGKDI
jgi:TRAP-type C4-dicarboxylate transport system permease small subunit